MKPNLKELKVKKLAKAKEVNGAGLEGLMGQRITLFALNYIYTGNLVGVCEKFVTLKDAAIVYETGDFSDPKWKNAQYLPHPVYVRLDCVESFMILKG